MMIRTRGLTTALLMAVAASAQAAGQVAVSFVQPETYADIGWTTAQRQQNLAILEYGFRSAAERLPDGQWLKVEVLDVDLAGETRVLFNHPDIRVLKGGVDYPRMHLRWTLGAGSQVLRSGEARLSDPSYLFHAHAVGLGDALAHDRVMIDRWLRETLVPGTPR
jgi:hypothetical protein